MQIRSVQIATGQVVTENYNFALVPAGEIILIPSAFDGAAYSAERLRQQWPDPHEFTTSSNQFGFIQEFVHVYSRRRPRETPVAPARDYLSALDIFATLPDDLDLGLALFIQHHELGAFDAVLTGLALNQRAQALVSADAAFGQVRDLLWTDPAASALNALLGSSG